MRRARVLIAACLAVVALTAARPAVAGPEPTARQVIVLLAPYVTWDDLSPQQTPTLWKLASEGAIGDVNARSRAAAAGLEEPSPLEGPLTLSAGLWSVPAPDAPAAYELTEPYGEATAQEAYEALFGRPIFRPRGPGDRRSIVYLGLPATERFQQANGLEADNGALGWAIREAGGGTAAVGNADLGVGPDALKMRLAPLAAMDPGGFVEYGRVSPSLLETDAASPYGVRADLGEFKRALTKAKAELGATFSPDASAGRGLLVLDVGDTVRAAYFRPFVADDAAVEQRRYAMRALDAVAALAVDAIGPDDVLVVTSQSLNGSAGVPEGLGPIMIWNQGSQAGGASDWNANVVLTSDSTHRAGLVTQLDVTATLFDLLDLERPVTVLGDTIYEVESPVQGAERIAYLQALDRTAVAVDSRRYTVLDAFVALTIVVLIAGAVVISRWRRWSTRVTAVARGVAQALVLLVLSVPPAAWLMFVWWPRPATASSALGSFGLAVLTLWVAAILLWRFAPARAPVMALSAITAGLLLADQWIGYPLSFVNYLGYSPLLGARFYGMGNEAAAILFGALVAALALAFDQWPAARYTMLARRWVVPLVGLLAVVTAAAPMLGANVGVAIWGTFGFALAWWLFNGHRVTWRLLLVVGVLVIVLVAVLAALDLTGATQTHLGRAITSAQQGGVVELWRIIARKAATNARVLTRTKYAYILLAVLAFLGFMRWRRAGELADTLRENRHFAQAITVILATGLLAFFTEDSGIVIPALISLYLGTGLLWVMLMRVVPERVECEPHERGAPARDGASVPADEVPDTTRAHAGAMQAAGDRR